MKRIIKGLLVLVATFVLTGCAKINAEIEVKEDLSYSVAMEVLYLKSYLEQMNISQEEFEESLKEEINVYGEEVDYETIERTIDGEDWIGIKVTTEGDGEEANVELQKNGDIITMSLPADELSEETDISSLTDMGYSIDDLKDMGFEMTMTIKMPGKVTSNYGDVNGDTVTIDLLELAFDESADTIEIEADCSVAVSSSSGSSSMMLYIGIGVAVVIVLGIGFVVMKKRKTTKTPIENNTNNIDNISYCPYCGYQLHGETVCPQCNQKV